MKDVSSSVFTFSGVRSDLRRLLGESSGNSSSISRSVARLLNTFSGAFVDASEDLPAPSSVEPPKNVHRSRSIIRNETMIRTKSIAILIRTPFNFKLTAYVFLVNHI